MTQVTEATYLEAWGRGGLFLAPPSDTMVRSPPVSSLLLALGPCVLTVVSLALIPWLQGDNFLVLVAPVLS